MNLATYFSVVWSLIMIYIVVGLYVHTVKILPKLREVHGQAHMALLPSEQLKQIDEYLNILDASGERPWSYLHLGHIRKTIAFLLLSMVSVVFLAATGVLG